jgi:hypothetical protein
MKDHKFSCQNCDEPFEILLPAETTKASFTECEEDHPKYHNLTHVSKMRKLSASKYDLLLYDWTSPEVYERSVMTLTKQTTLVILTVIACFAIIIFVG